MKSQQFKRVIDIIGSLIGLILVSPIILVISLMVYLTMGRPIFFKQARPGLYGKPFTIYKFRTMLDLRDKNGNLLPDEKRLTPFGKLLRKFSIDELPELWNVLKGDMSLVGPRPLPLIDIEHPELLHPKDSEINLERLDNWLKIRHSVPPGITGLWQVRGRSDLPLEAWFNYDLEYVKRRSFWMDMKILLRTIPVVLLGKGAE